MIKKKNTRKKISKVLNKWIKTLPKELRSPVKNNVFVSGGAIVSLMTGEPVNDYDVYFTNKTVLVDVVRHYVGLLGAPDAKVKEAEYGVKAFIQSSGILRCEGHQKKPYKPIVITDNAITLSGGVQIITRFCGEPEEVHKHFDFVHCMCYYRLSKDELVIPHRAAESIMSKELIYGGSLFPICSIIRLRKFIRRGWSINAGEILKMSFQVSQLDLTDIGVLKDQLVGVDALYFLRLIESLQQLKDEGESIDASVVCQLVDEVFG